MNRRCMTQTELAERWRISEATLERWRTESNGPMFLKLGNQVRYRLQDVEAFEEAALRGSTKTDVEVDQAVVSHRTLPRLTQPPARPARPVTIWLRTGTGTSIFRRVHAVRPR